MKLPIIFLGHGNPMNVLYKEKEFISSLQKITPYIEKSKGVIFISAHWLNKTTSITANKKPEIIYDFFGFPKELYEIEIDLNGDEKLSIDIAKKLGIEIDKKRGFDHGVWTLLKLLNQKITKPVFQISINTKYSLSEHFEFAKKLKKLQEEGYLIIGSGNVVHNLYNIDFNLNEAYPWAIEFNQNIKKLITNKEIEQLLNYNSLKNSNLANPELSHYIPLIYIMSLIEDKDKIEFIYDKIQNGSISMLSFIAKENGR